MTTDVPPDSSIFGTPEDGDRPVSESLVGLDGLVVHFESGRGVRTDGCSDWNAVLNLNSDAGEEYSIGAMQFLMLRDGSASLLEGLGLLDDVDADRFRALLDGNNLDERVLDEIGALTSNRILAVQCLSLHPNAKELGVESWFIAEVVHHMIPDGIVLAHGMTAAEASKGYWNGPTHDQLLAAGLGPLGGFPGFHGQSATAPALATARCSLWPHIASEVIATPSAAHSV
ncbi:hypothetical protein CH275_12155 [Rhodococcus sp. 06-235-1A]|nr:hypothetical protein CH275_12155 [Rhodococcus sp. 06-235-1A]